MFWTGILLAHYLPELDLFTDVALLANKLLCKRMVGIQAAYQLLIDAGRLRGENMAQAKEIKQGEDRYPADKPHILEPGFGEKQRTGRTAENSHAGKSPDESKRDNTDRARS